jgi:hypothetical protein
MSKESKGFLKDYIRGLERGLVESEAKCAYLKFKIENEEDEERKKELQVVADQNEANTENARAFIEFLNNKYV